MLVKLSSDHLSHHPGQLCVEFIDIVVCHPCCIIWMQRDHLHAIPSTNAVPHTIFSKEVKDLVQMDIGNLLHPLLLSSPKISILMLACWSIWLNLCHCYWYLPDVINAVCRMGYVKVDKVRVKVAAIIGGCHQRNSQYCRDIVIDKCPLPCKVERVGRNRLSVSIHGSYHAYSKLCRFAAGFDADVIVSLNTLMKDMTVMLKIA